MRIDLRFEETIDELMLKPGTRPVEKKKVDENVEYEIGPYKYENPDDSFYCSQHAVSIIWECTIFLYLFYNNKIIDTLGKTLDSVDVQITAFVKLQA